MVTTDGYGPLYTVQEDVEAMPLDLVIVNYVPDFSGTSLSEVSEVLARSANLDRTATRDIGDAANQVTVTTQLTDTLGGVVGSLAVTRSSVLVTGLLLLVLAVAALSQTARLMAERRYGGAAPHGRSRRLWPPAVPAWVHRGGGAWRAHRRDRRTACPPRVPGAR